MALLLLVLVQASRSVLLEALLVGALACHAARALAAGAPLGVKMLRTRQQRGLHSFGKAREARGPQR
jgi:hypothetical protein